LNNYYTSIPINYSPIFLSSYHRYKTYNSYNKFVLTFNRVRRSFYWLHSFITNITLSNGSFTPTLHLVRFQQRIASFTQRKNKKRVRKIKASFYCNKEWRSFARKFVN
ncbi:hypothetical protein KSS87_012496, partial [Heliosperma pusillum]